MKELGTRWLKRIARSDEPNKWVPCICEIARGSKAKYALDKKTGQLQLDRALAPGLEYPVNYGFVAHTMSTDDMEMDVLILSEEPLLPLTIVRVKIIGGLTVEEGDKGREDKLVGVATDDPSVDMINDLEQVPRDQRAHIERFLGAFKRDQRVESHVSGWFGRHEAHQRLAKALELGRKKKT